MARDTLGTEIAELLERRGIISKDPFDLAYDDASVEGAERAAAQLEKTILGLMREFETGTGAIIGYVELLREAGVRDLPQPPARSPGPLVDIKLEVKLDTEREG